MYSQARFLVAGDRGLTVEFGNEVSPRVNLRVLELASTLEQARIPGVIEWIPTFRSLFILYNPLLIKLNRLIQEIEKLERNRGAPPPLKSRVLEIPVVYGGEYAQDLGKVAEYLHLTSEEVIQIHCSEEYLVYMNGFMGGTAFIKMPEKLSSLPRKKTPVLGIPGGTVMIAGGLGSVFKVFDAPTGWHAIGKSPLKQWFPQRDPPLLIMAGDMIRYRPIDEKEFREIKKMVEEDTYTVKRLE